MDAAAQEMQVRRDQLKAWIAAHYPSTRAFCRAHGLNESEISQLLRTKSFGSRRARNLEQQTGMPFRYLEGTPTGAQHHKVSPGTAYTRPNATTPFKPWPFRLTSYEDLMALTPEKRHELDIRVSEFVAGAILKKRKA